VSNFKAARNEACGLRRDNPELAAEIEGESIEDYAEHRGIELLNPQERRQVQHMATAKELQAEIDDLQERVDEAISILEDAYTPEASREDLAEAAGNALDVLTGEEEEEEEQEEEEEED
jgi:hypothetical protein